MNSMERVVKALNHQEADRIPVYPIICGASRTDQCKLQGMVE